jgi:[acyl-carrier-protein] S-malonyltransferase
MSISKFAFIFPGQGSQKVGMLSLAAEKFPEIESCFSEASDVLDYNLWDLAQKGPIEKLNLTEITQPLILTASVSLWKAWISLNGKKPNFLAGHSLGEFSALVCSNVLNFRDAVDLVRQRAKFMQQAVPVGVGAMSAIIGLDDRDVVEACAECSDKEIVQAVNFNSPGQIVIAGHKDAVSNAGLICKEKGAKRVLPLPVSAPFHTLLMRDAADKLSDVIKNIHFSAPEIPVLHNVNAMMEDCPKKIKSLMVKQTYMPVQWTKSMMYLRDAGVDVTLECGPGKVLSGLSKRIDKSFQVGSLELPDDMSNYAGISKTF